MYFDVTQDASTDEDGVAVIEAVKPNTAQKGVIKISKSGEVFSSVTEADGLYQPVFSVQSLPGTVYEITAAEDTITPDGTARYGKGEIVDTVTTNETGLAESKPLPIPKKETYQKNKELRKLIGSRAKQRRVELGLNQPYVAEKMG